MCFFIKNYRLTVLYLKKYYGYNDDHGDSGDGGDSGDRGDNAYHGDRDDQGDNGKICICKHNRKLSFE